MSWSQPPRSAPITRSNDAWRRSDIIGMLLACLAGGLLGYFAGSWSRGERGGIDRHFPGDDRVVPRMLDPLGMLPREEGDYDEAPRRRRRLPLEAEQLPRGEGDYEEAPRLPLRPPPGSGHGGGHAGTNRADRFPRDQQGHPHGRWKECSGPRQHPRCGPWQTGPMPGEE